MPPVENFSALHVIALRRGPLYQFSFQVFDLFGTIEALEFLKADQCCGARDPTIPACRSMLGAISQRSRLQAHAGFHMHLESPAVSIPLGTGGLPAGLQHGSGCIFTPKSLTGGNRFRLICVYSRARIEANLPKMEFYSGRRLEVFYLHIFTDSVNGVLLAVSKGI